MNTSRRFSRFHPTSSPPPYLTAILRNLVKACRTRPVEKNVVRSECASANPWYKDKGKSDDCFRFLINVGILLEEDKTYYFDEARANVVQECIKQRRQPPTAATTTIRLAFVKAAIAEARTSSPCAVVPDPTPSSDETEPDSEPPKTDRSSVAVPVVLAPAPTPSEPPPVEPPKTLVPPATFHSLPAPTGFIEPQFVIYLTPVEKDVWESAVIQARQIADSKRVGIPNDPESLQSAWGDTRIVATPEDYMKALQRFVDAELIRVIGASGNGHVAYEFVREPELYHVVPISSRENYEMAPVYLEILRAIQNGIYIPAERGLQHHFSEWVSTRWPAVSPKTVYNKMVNFSPDSEYIGYGILYRHGNHYLLSVKGLERFDFVSNNKEVLRHNRVPHEPEASDTEPEASEVTAPNPEQVQDPNPSEQPVNGVAEDVIEDVDVEVKIRELEESIAQQQSELVAWKLVLQRKQDAEREALKREIAEATRLRNEADKREADARAKLRKLGIELPK